MILPATPRHSLETRFAPNSRVREFIGISALNLDSHFGGGGLPDELGGEDLSDRPGDVLDRVSGGGKLERDPHPVDGEAAPATGGVYHVEPGEAGDGRVAVTAGEGLHDGDVHQPGRQAVGVRPRLHDHLVLAASETL